MKYKIKVRVTSPDSKQNKYSLNVQDGENLVINKDTPGLSLKHESAQNISCVLFVRDGGLVAKGADGGPGVIVNQNEKSVTSLRIGDVLSFGAYSIEFLDIPVSISKEYSEPQTQFIDMSSAKVDAPRIEQPVYDHPVYEAPKTDYPQFDQPQALPQPKWGFWQKYSNQFAIAGAVGAVAIGLFSFYSIRSAKQETITAQAEVSKLMAQQQETAKSVQAQKDYLIQLQQELDLAKTAQKKPAPVPVAQINPEDIEKFVTAAATGDMNGVKTFIKKKHGEAAVRNKAGTPALVAAAKAGELEVTHYLVSHDAEINARDKKGMTALMWATAKKNAEIVSYLLSQNADPKLKNKDGKKALDIATKAKAKNIVALLKKGTGGGREVASEKKSKKKKKSKDKDKKSKPKPKKKKKSEEDDI